MLISHLDYCYYLFISLIYPKFAGMLSLLNFAFPPSGHLQEPSFHPFPPGTDCSVAVSVGCAFISIVGKIRSFLDSVSQSFLVRYFTRVYPQVSLAFALSLWEAYPLNFQHLTFILSPVLIPLC